MGPAGWFLMPHVASYWGQWYPWAAPAYLYSQPWDAPPAAQELQFLKGQAEMLEGQLEWVRARITELEAAEQQKT